MDPNAVNPYQQNNGMAPTQPVAPVPTYPNTSQLYDPLANDRPKPDWQQAIYSNLATQQLMPEQQAVQSFAPPQQPQYAPPAVAPSPQATYAAIADATNAPMGDIVVADGYGNSGSGTKKSILFILVIGLLLVGITGATGLGMYRYGYGKGASSAQAVIGGDQEPTDEVPPADESEEDVTPTFDFSLRRATYIEDTVMGRVGEQLEAPDGFVLLVDKVHRDYVSDNESSGVLDEETGTELIRVDMLVGNADEAKPMTIKNTNFSVADESGELIPAEDAVALYEDSPATITLASGMKAKLSVFFKVPLGTENLALARSQQYRVSGEIVTMSTIAVLFNESGINDSADLP